MTQVRKMMLEELQGRKSLHWGLALFRSGWFDLISEVSEFAKHLPSAQLLRSLAKPGAAFFISHSFVQNQPDQTALSMGNGPDCLIVPKARNHPAIDDFNDTSFRPGSGVRSLIE